MEVALAIDVPDTVRSFPVGTCWPLVGDVIFIFGTCCCDDVVVVLFPAVDVFCGMYFVHKQRHYSKE